MSYRFACRVGMCGSCAMVVNGRPRWTCRTRVSEAVDGDGKLAARAAAQFHGGQGPRRRDDGVLRQVARRQGPFRAGRGRRPISRSCRRRRRERQAADAGIECIGCGVCHSACDVVTWNKDYLGPAPLNRAWTLVNDVRDAGNDARIDAVSGSAGCHACHSHMNCTEFCPRAISPTYSIAGIEARDDEARAGAEADDRDPVRRPARLGRGAGVRRHRASRHHSLCRARRPDRGRGAGAHPRQPLVLRLLCAVRAGGRGACADRACATCSANGRRGSGRSLDVALALFALLLLVIGFRAAVAVYLPPEAMLG